jgi:tetratricopeptide (TPR) repeat protein
MQGWAILPDGEKKWLVWIRNWDIDRQSGYRYKWPLLLPKSTVLHDARVHSSLSQVLDAMGQFEEAFAEQKRALQLDPQDADGWTNLGALLARGGQNDAARPAFKHVLKLQPDHAQARANLARLASRN